MPTKTITKRKPKKKAATRTKAGSQQRAVKKAKLTEDTKLLAMEQRFADEYLKDLNQTQAAIRAGYSPKGAARQAHVLKKQPNVSAYIARKLAEQSARTGFEFERIMREAARIAFVNPLDVLDPESGRIVGDDPNNTASIQSLKVKHEVFGGDDGGESTEREVRFHNKTQALDLLLKYHRTSAEFEKKMAVEREKLAIQREQLELEKRRVAIQESVAAQEKDGFNKILNILDPFGDNQKQQNDMQNAENQGVLSETDNKSTSGGESE